MKVLQIIDSLHAGGAERMAVNYANMLHEQGVESFLCCTREEGLLKKSLHPGIDYIFLNKKTSLDFKAILKLKNYIKKNEIEVLHAHGTSFFTATIQKLINPKLKLFWHDHYGKSEDLEHRNFSVLKRCSRFFDAIFSVNENLMEWAQENLQSKHVFYIKNFIASAENKIKSIINLKGGHSTKLICLANFRPQKNHFLLLESFRSIQKDKNISLHLFGKNWNDKYFLQVKEIIDSEENVYYYGSQNNVQEILLQADIGVLSSDSEGLPMALLEYAQAGLAVVATDVGQSASVITNNGHIVPPRDSKALAEALLDYLENSQKRKKDAAAFQEHIQKNYSDAAVFPQILDIYKKMLSLKS